MTQVRNVASKDFVLFRADHPTGEAREAVQKLQPKVTHVVVRRWEPWDGGQVFHYLYTVQEFLDRLVHVPGEVPLVYALNLHESDATSVRDADGNAETAPSHYVITDGDRVVGYRDVTSSPIESYDYERKGPLPTPAEPIAPVSRSLRTDFPDAVPQKQTASLLVWLATQGGSRTDLPVVAPIGARLDVVVQAQRGFALEGSGEGTLVITGEDETLPIRFKLTATDLGPGKVRVFCFQGGHPLGAITLTPTVIPTDQAVTTGRATESRNLAPLRADQPDLTLLIFEQKVGGQTEITLRLTAVDPKLGLNFKPFGPIRLVTEPLGYFQTFFEDIEGLRVETDEQRAIAARRLTLKGARLFQDLLPTDLQGLLWSLRERISTVQVLSDEPWIPWELLRLQGKEDGRIVEGPFLCEAFAMTRWFPGIARQPELSLRQMAVVVPGNSNLPSAPEEQKYLLSLTSAQRQVTALPATYLDVVDALSEGKYDGWHFTGHGRFEAPDPNRSAIQLERGQKLCAEEIAGAVSNCGLARPLVFLNACQTGREALSLTGIGGWARRFIEAGAAAFIGSLWSVYDKAAYQFTQEFYKRLLAGSTLSVGQAAKEARAAIRPLGDPTWLAYTVYADPMARVS